MSGGAGDLFAQILALPADVNPYAWVKNLLWRQITPEILPWARALLYVNLAAIVASSGLAGWVLWDRQQQKTLWFFRTQSTRCGRLILPNTSIIFVACSLAFVPLALANLIYLLVSSDRDNLSAVPNTWSWAYVWTPVHAAIWGEAHGLAIAVLLASTQIKIKAVYVNWFFLAMYPVPTIINFGGFAVAAMRVRDVWNAYRAIADAVQPTLDTWSVGAPFQFKPEWLPRLNTFESAGRDYFPAGAKAAACHLVGHTLVALVFTPACLAYFQILRKQLKQTTTHLNSSTGSMGSRESDVRLRNLRSSYRAMVFEAMAVSLGGATYVAVCIWVAADSRSILLSGPKTSLLYVLPFSVWSLFGIPALAIIAVRLYQQRAKGSKWDSAAEGFGPLSLVEGIRIETEVSVVVDGDHELQDSKSRRVVVDLPDTFGRESFVDMEKDAKGNNWR